VRVSAERAAVLVLLAACSSGSSAPLGVPSGSGAPLAPVASALGVAAAAATAATPRDPAPPEAPLVRDAAPAQPGAVPYARYEIDLAVDDVTGTFAGTARIRYRNPSPAPLAALPLVLHPNASAELGPVDSGSLAVASVDVDPDAPGAPAIGGYALAGPSRLQVRFTTPLAPGGEARLRVRYEGRLRRLPPTANDPFAQAMLSLGAMSSGVGAADYGLLAVGDGIVTAASAYPMVAPFREGSFDESRPGRIGDLAYNHVASYRVRTVVPAGVSIVTNLVDGEPGALADGARVYVSEGELVRDFVLVAGRDLERAHKNVGGTRVASVYRARDARGGKIALEVAASSLASFERRFGPYPYRELDVVEASLVGGAGGVEFSGLVLIAGMLYRPLEDSTSALAQILKLWGNLASGIASGLEGKPQRPATPPTDSLLDDALEFTVAHEVAHQYFAGIVGNDARRHPSLDEPAAQYAAGLAVEDRRGAKAAGEAMDKNVKLNYALYRLLGGADRPVLRDTASYRTAVEYAALVYGKAPYAYVALRKALGDDKLHGAMRAAVERHRFGLVTTEEWIAALEDATGGPRSPVRPTLRRYLEETHGDADLGVDDSGDFVLDAIFPPDVAAALRAALPAVGMKPRDLLRMVFGGGLGDDAPIGPGIDPTEALRKLEKLRH
jgi:hypothetical protein